MLGAVRPLRRFHGLGQEHGRAGAGETEPPLHPGESQQCMVARIGPGRNPKIELAGAQGSARGAQLFPRPAMQAVFPGEGRPGCEKRQMFDVGHEAREERVGVGRREHGDPGVRGRRAQKRHGQREVAEAP